METKLEIRAIEKGEFEAYWALRLFALRHSPDAFRQSYESEAEVPLAQRMNRMEERMSAENVIYVVDDGQRFVGMTGVARNTRPKTRHIALIWGVYVMPELRGRGLGRRLVKRAVDQAKSWEGLKAIQLSVVSSRSGARKLYKRLGFVEWGLEPAAIMVDGKTYDEAHLTMMID